MPSQKSNNKIFLFTFTSLLVLLFSFSLFSPITFGQSAEELEQKIDEQKNRIGELDKEIEEQRKKLLQVNAQANTLQNTVNSLNLTEKKITTDIKKTETGIEKSSYALEKLAVEISDKQKKINSHREVLAEMIQKINELESNSLIEIVLLQKDFSELFNNLRNLEVFQGKVFNTLQVLQELNQELVEDKEETEEEKISLEKLKQNLAGEKQVVTYTKKEKEQVLAVTKNTEAEYQRILKEKELARAQIESELQSLEAKLQYTLNPDSLPSKGSGALGYPVENPLVTQGFGLTSFALSGAYGYSNGQPNPHRGVDFRAPIGTKLLASADGTVRATYDMDAVPGCKSYGQWILIDYNNGLSSLYAHLSVRSVSSGQTVSRGEVIGFSGNSGYSTAPHLHYSVFPSDGVNVQKFSNSIGCKNASIPIAAYNAYLNPLDYFK